MILGLTESNNIYKNRWLLLHVDYATGGGRKGSKEAREID